MRGHRGHLSGGVAGGGDEPREELPLFSACRIGEYQQVHGYRKRAEAPG